MTTVTKPLTMEMNMESNWRRVGDDGKSSTLTFRCELTGEVALKRDNQIMSYMRGLCHKQTGEPLLVNPIGITGLWDEAYMAGMDHVRPEVPELGPKPNPKKKARKKRKQSK